MRYALILNRLDLATGLLHEEEHARYTFRFDANMVGDNMQRLYPEWVFGARVEVVVEAVAA